MTDPLRIEEQFRRAHDDEENWLAYCEATGVFPGIGYEKGPNGRWRCRDFTSRAALRSRRTGWRPWVRHELLAGLPGPCPGYSWEPVGPMCDWICGGCGRSR